jgi:hypothetical protein
MIRAWVRAAAISLALVLHFEASAWANGSRVEVFVIDFAATAQSEGDGALEAIVRLIRQQIGDEGGRVAVLDARQPAHGIIFETQQARGNNLPLVVKSLLSGVSAGSHLDLPAILDAAGDVASALQEGTDRIDIYLINAIYNDQPDHHFADGYPNDGYLQKDDTDFARVSPHALPHAHLHVLATGDQSYRAQYQRFFYYVAKKYFDADLASFSLGGWAQSAPAACRNSASHRSNLSRVVWLLATASYRAVWSTPSRRKWRSLRMR